MEGAKENFNYKDQTRDKKVIPTKNRMIMIMTGNILKCFS